MRNRKGFTLVEIIVGLAITGLILTFTYASVNFSSAVTADMREQAKVANVLESAAEKVFAMRESSWSGIATGLTFTASDIPLMNDFLNSSLSITVSAYEGNPDLKSVFISFSWDPASRRFDKTQNLRTVISKKQ